MRHKFFLPIVFLLTMFISQQVKASSNSLSNINAIPQFGLQQGITVPETIWAYMYHLNLDGSRAQGDILCGSGDTNYGCIAEDSGQLYPYDFNPQEVSLENDYLLNVVTREMLPKKYHEKAVYAQAIAARSFVYYTVDEFGFVENSTNDQVFVPYTFEHWLDGYPNNSNNPCAGTNLTVYQQIVCDATSSRYYIVPNGSNQPANTEFSSDIYSVTVGGSEPYLISVQDPISTVCDTLTGIFGNDRGMSQEGASRWARGDQCAMDESGNIPWPVKWNDYRQILAHYYTGIDILDGSGTPVAPDDRWNLLWHDVPSGATINANTSINFNVRIQNTSTVDWGDNEIKVWYKWTGENWIDTEIYVPSTQKGQEKQFNVANIISPSNGGDTLHLDLRRQNGSLFSEQTPNNWPDATIDIHVNGPAATPTPTETPIPTVTPTPIAQGILPSQSNGGPAYVTVSNLIPGMQYRIVVSGVVHFNNWILVDPQWNDYQMSSGCFCRRGQAIVFNGTALAAQNGQKVYDPNHRYTFLWLADSTKLQMYVSDSIYYDNYGNFTYQIFEDSFIGTPTPTAPVITVTPQPTVCTTVLCLWTQCSSAGKFVGAKVADLAQGYSFVTGNFDRISDQAALLYRVRDEILNTTEEGQRYTDLYYAHSAEIAAIMNSHSEIAEQGLNVIDVITPNLQALLDGQGNTATITSGQVQQAQAFLDAILPYASPQLQEAIADEQVRQPLEQLSGMTMNQAWVEINSMATPTPTETATPTFTLSPTITSSPIQTATETLTLTLTLFPTETSTPAQTASVTPAPTNTDTPANTPTETLTPTATSSATPTFTPTYTSTPTVTPAPITLALYLHGNGATANPPTLFLDSLAPTDTTTKYKDSTSVNFNGGNSWKEVGDWAADPMQTSGQLTALNNLQVWLGLKNSDDQGTNFDLRVEIYENDTLVGSAESLCITGITRNPNLAKQVILPFDTLPPAGFNGTTDEFSLIIKTRIGTNGAGGMCGGHSNAVGLRLYFDALNRPAGFDGVFGP